MAFARGDVVSAALPLGTGGICLILGACDLVFGISTEILLAAPGPAAVRALRRLVWERANVDIDLSVDLAQKLGAELGVLVLPDHRPPLSPLVLLEARVLFRGRARSKYQFLVDLVGRDPAFQPSNLFLELALQVLVGGEFLVPSQFIPFRAEIPARNHELAGIP